MLYKIIENGYILAIGDGNQGEQITQKEYDSIIEVVRNKPPHTETTDYRLRENLTWEAYELPPLPEPEPDAEEILDVLLGGAE